VNGTRTVLVAIPSATAVALLTDAAELLTEDRRISTVFTGVPGVRRTESDLVLTAGSAHGALRLSRGALDGAVLHTLAHEADYLPLRKANPGALPAATVVGDLCYDRLLASIPFRAGYRRALGVSRERKLIVVSDVDGRAELVERLLAALPAERYQVAAVTSADEGWRAALIAANLVIGGDGEVIRYGAAIGLPVMTVTARQRGPRADDVTELLRRHARRLRFDEPLAAQVDMAMRGGRAWQDGVAARVTSRSGRAGELLRRVMYRFLGLAEPVEAVPCDPVPLPCFGTMEQRGRGIVSAQPAMICWPPQVECKTG
jgi:hypothetical protein